MIDKGTIIQVLGSIMRNPSLLSERDKYVLTPDDFPSNFEKIIFVSLHNLYENGAKKITAIDVDNFLNTNPSSKAIFNHNNGIEYLTDVYDYADPDNFQFYYGRLKKLNLLLDLQEIGIDTSKIYDDKLIAKNSREINERFEEMSITEIIENLKKEITLVEADYGVGDSSSTLQANEGIEELINNLKLEPDSGAPLQGHVFNTITKGARKGKYYVRSAASAVGKSRLAVGDACYLSYPIRFNPDRWSWEINGSNEKSLIIITEQEADEIQTMIMAYLTGINEEKILYGQYNIQEEKVIKQAIQVMDYFKENLIIVQMPNPNITKVRSVVLQNKMMHDIDNVFYDYIFVNPSLLTEFRDYRLRNDEALLMFSTALKDLAVETQTFVMTSTQLNAKGEENEEGAVKNESAIRGSRAIIDKADIGVIVSRVTAQERKILEESNLEMLPNQVIDVFKVRRGRFTQVRIWSVVDLGTCRKEDVLITDSFFQKVEGFVPMVFSRESSDYLKWKEFIKRLEN